MELYEVEVRVVVHTSSADMARDIALAAVGAVEIRDGRIVSPASATMPTRVNYLRGNEIYLHAGLHGILATHMDPFEHHFEQPRFPMSE